jgi:hypothetical protein
VSKTALLVMKEPRDWQSSRSVDDREACAEKGGQSSAASQFHMEDMAQSTAAHRSKYSEKKYTSVHHPLDADDEQNRFRPGLHRVASPPTLSCCLLVHITVIRTQRTDQPGSRIWDGHGQSELKCSIHAPLPAVFCLLLRKRTKPTLLFAVAEDPSTCLGMHNPAPPPHTDSSTSSVAGRSEVYRVSQREGQAVGCLV